MQVGSALQAERYHAKSGLVKPVIKIEDRCLAGTVGPDQCGQRSEPRARSKLAPVTARRPSKALYRVARPPRSGSRSLSLTFISFALTETCPAA